MIKRRRIPTGVSIIRLITRRHARYSVQLRRNEIGIYEISLPATDLAALPQPVAIDSTIHTARFEGLFTDEVPVG